MYTEKNKKHLDDNPLIQNGKEKLLPEVIAFDMTFLWTIMPIKTYADTTKNQYPRDPAIV